MTSFDLIALAVVGLSAIAGFSRGAVREFVGLFAFTLSALGTVVLLPAAVVITRHFIHSGWLAAVAAAVGLFVVIFLLLRVLAGALTASIHRTPVLGAANRMGGLVFGGLRAVVLLSLFALVFNRVTPRDMRPDWIVGGAAYPLATRSAGVLQALLPRGLRLAGGLTPALGHAVKAASGDETLQTGTPSSESETDAPHASSLPRAKPKDRRYTKHARDSVDTLVERSN